MVKNSPGKLPIILLSFSTNRMCEQNNCYQTFVIPIRITPEPTNLGIEDFPNLVDTFLKDKDGIVEYFEVYKVAVFYHNNLLSNDTYLILIRVFTYLRPVETIYQVNDRVLIKKGCNKGLTGTICKNITSKNIVPPTYC